MGINKPPNAENTALAKTDVPDYIAEMGLMQDSGHYSDDFGLVRPEDIGIEFLKIVQSNSVEAKPNWDDNGAAPIAQGTMILSRSKTVIPIGTPLILLLRSIKFIKWNDPKNPQKGREFETSNPEDPRIVSIKGLEWLTDPVTGRRSKPQVDTFHNYYAITPKNLKEPACLSFYRAGIKRARKMFQDILRATDNGKMPMYCLKFTLDEPTLEKNNDNQQWFEFNIRASGFAKKETIEKAQALYETARSMSMMIQDGQTPDNDGGSSAPLKDATNDAAEIKTVEVEKQQQAATQESVPPPQAEPETAPEEEAVEEAW